VVRTMCRNACSSAQAEAFPDRSAPVSSRLWLRDEVVRLRRAGREMRGSKKPVRARVDWLTDPGVHDQRPVEEPKEAPKRLAVSNAALSILTDQAAMER
jgi:hypothetical protein